MRFPSLGKAVMLPFQGLKHRGSMAEEKATLASFQKEVGRLVEQFTRNHAHYSEKGYDEASLRNEFLNPFFRALGWDVENKAGRIPKQREVEIESRTEISGRTKRADFLFRIEGHERFVCEAKKPGHALTAPAAFQAKRYVFPSLKVKMSSATIKFQQVVIFRMAHGWRSHASRNTSSIQKLQFGKSSGRGCMVLLSQSLLRSINHSMY